MRAEEGDVHGVGVLDDEIITTIRAAAPAIRPMRMLLIRVRSGWRGALRVRAVVGWLSFRALESERAERTAREARLEENARLARWRFGSSVAPLIVQENANSSRFSGR